MGEISVEVTRMRMGVESTEARVAKLEKTAGVAMRMLVASLVVLSMVLALLAIVLLQMARR